MFQCEQQRYREAFDHSIFGMVAGRMLMEIVFFMPVWLTRRSDRMRFLEAGMIADAKFETRSPPVVSKRCPSPQFLGWSPSVLQSKPRTAPFIYCTHSLFWTAVQRYSFPPSQISSGCSSKTSVNVFSGSFLNSSRPGRKGSFR